MEFKYEQFRWFNNTVNREVNEFFSSLTEEQFDFISSSQANPGANRRIKWKEALEMLCRMNVAEFEKNKLKELDETHYIISKEYHKKLTSLIDKNRNEYRREYMRTIDLQHQVNELTNKYNFSEEHNHKLKEELDKYRSKELEEYEECLEE